MDDAVKTLMDGHVASRFRGCIAHGERTGIAAAVDRPGGTTWSNQSTDIPRLTLIIAEGGEQTGTGECATYRIAEFHV